MKYRRCPERPHLLDGYPLGQYHCPSCGCMVLAGMEHPHEPEYCRLPLLSEEEYQEELEIADRSYARVVDPNTDPNEELPRLSDGQVWVWMTGPVEPHWAIRWTGALLISKPEGF